MDVSSLRFALVAMVLPLALAACSPSRPVVRPSIPNAGRDPTPLAKCKVAASQESPLVTEWPASEKANLEARLREGGVAVAYTGCSLRLVPQCRLPGSYKWQRTTVSSDRFEIRSEDELYAKLPIGAAALEGDLKNAGRLAVDTTVAGQLKLDGLALSDVPKDGECAEATHVVGGLSVGAFQLKSGGSVSVQAGATLGSAAVGGASNLSEATLRSAGSAEKCSEATDESPHVDCQSPLQIFLWRLPHAKRGEEIPEDSVKLEFVSTSGSKQWEILDSGKERCKTPCTQWVKRSSVLAMRESVKEGEGSELAVTGIDQLDPGTEARVVYKDTNAAWYIGNWTMIFGASPLILGAVFVPVSCFKPDDPSNDGLKQLCSIGVAMAAAGGAVFALGLTTFALWGEKEHMEVEPAGGQARRPLRPAIFAGPGGIWGRF